MIDYCWTSSKCDRVCFLAAPFGYGPRISAEYLASLLKIELRPWKRSSQRPLETHASLRLLLNFEVDTLTITTSRAVFRVWIDCLMWLRSSLPPETSQYDVVLAQSFFPVKPHFLRMPNTKVISPLIKTSHLIGRPAVAQHSNPIFISFGGIETPYTENVHRYLMQGLVLESVIGAAEKNNDRRRILCCAPSGFCQRMAANSRFSEIHFVSPTHQTYLQLLWSSSLSILQPGLFGPFEAFASRVPTFFSPPFSYTQVCQSRKYEEFGLLGQIPTWRALDKVVGDLVGDVSNEEPVCFQKLSRWLTNDLSRSEHRDAMCLWAQGVLRDSEPCDELTQRRFEYTESCLKLSGNHLRLLSQLLA